MAHTTRSDGDLSPSAVDPAVLGSRRRTLVDLPWVSCRQVHSDRVVRVDGDLVAMSDPVLGVGTRRAPAPDGRPVADALITNERGIVLAVHTGDCVPVAFVHSSGVIAAAHAGWKGLHAGVLESTRRSLMAMVTAGSGQGSLHAVVGPHIRAARYEFDAADLEQLASRFGPGVIGRTSGGRPALDLTAAVSVELARLGIDATVGSAACTADEADRFWSHRARKEPGRIALMVWVTP